MEKPLVQAFLVCEQVITDERTHRKSLINVFNQAHARTFPFILPYLVIFASMTNGNGVVPFEVRCVQEASGELLFRTGGPIQFADPIALVELVIEFNVSFPAPGAYSFMLFCDEELLAERRFHVVPPPPPPAS